MLLLFLLVIAYLLLRYAALLIIVNILLLTQARNFRFPCGLVYVAEPGYVYLHHVSLYWCLYLFKFWPNGGPGHYSYQEHNDHLDISVVISYLKELCSINCRYFLRAKVPRHAIIKKFGGEEISRLEDLISVLSKLARGARVPLEYINYLDRHRRKVLVIIYFPVKIYQRLHW